MTSIVESTSTLQEELERVYQKYGVLEPENVVAEASDPEHPLHGYFEWDDTTAAHEFRCVQARVLIRRVRIREETAEGVLEVRSWVANRDLGNATPGYTALRDLKEDPEALAYLERTFMQRWRDMQRTYSHLKVYREMVLETARELDD